MKMYEVRKLNSDTYPEATSTIYATDNLMKAYAYLNSLKAQGHYDIYENFVFGVAPISTDPIRYSQAYYKNVLLNRPIAVRRVK